MKAGENLKLSKKKANMPSNKAETTRDWGKGMACVGRTKECTLVEKNHFGPIPGIEVGTSWKYRIQVSSVYYIKYRNICTSVIFLTFTAGIFITY